ncbi:putative disease resistance protein RGA3 [Chenopodium quinoa]|uniref:putative disease resistance protein RGA3 n=1 Tax=Chenopodium quinoa TaxID=63459 RepID=UPI000B78A052|nr:putative disease resistance protein RGA3 [Chenopodium quinoa]
MDVASLLTLVQALLQLLDSSFANKIASAWSFKSQLAKMKDTMTAITAILLDAEERERQQFQRRSNVEHDWLEKLRDAVYEADDLFDEVAALARRKELISGNQLAKELSLFFSHSNHLAFGYKTSRKVKKIRERLDEIAKDHHDFGSSSLSLVTSPMGRMMVKRREDIHSFVNEDVIGRDEEYKAILDMLMDSSLHDNLFIVTIVGVGGLGKTTLAQLVYNDERIKSEFPLRLWVCVSVVFDIKVILHKILSSTTNDKYDHLEMDQLWCLVQEIMSKSKYFLVLDDVWNENRHKWLELRNLLIKGQRGSRIVVTTRSNMVARILGDSSTYDLKGFSEEDSWHLFEKMAFEKEVDQMDMGLVEIGKSILKKCCNVPLAIRVVGSLLYGQGKPTWLLFKDLDLRKIKQEDNNDIMPILKLSYHHLALSLKSCFSYCVLFPKEYRIEKDILIGLWIANHFIVPLDGQSVEEAGEEHFMTLLQRCFFQDVERDDVGEIVSCKVHDLMHEVAQEVAETDVIYCVAGQLKNNYRHLSLGHLDVGSILRSVGDLKRLRTLFLLGHIKGSLEVVDSDTRELFSKEKCLRVLRLCHKSIKSLPNTIDKLIHLRYLDLSYNYELQFLPATICELINLQTLKLKKCWSLEELPKNLRKLVNLRHLDLNDCFNLSHMPPGMSNLICLQSLSRFVVCFDTTAPACRGKLEDLEILANLRGNLQIVVISTDQTHDDAKLTQAKYVIRGLECLKSIKVNGGSAALLEGLQPHPNVRCLTLKQYEGTTFPKWESSEDLRTSLPVLRDLLGIPTDLKEIPSQQDNLEYIEDNSGDGDGGAFSASSGPSTTWADDQSMSFFPSLESLYLIHFPELKGWQRCSSGDMDLQLSYDEQNQPFFLRPVPYQFPRLSLLDIKHCPNLTSIPLSTSLEKLILCSSSDESNSFLSYGTGISQQLTIGFGKNESLTSLFIVREVFHNCLFPTLCSLEIQGWSKLKSLCGGGLEHLITLQELYLQDLDELEELDDHMPWRSLTNLRYLGLKNLPKLLSLPKGVQRITSLQSLSIDGCNQLASLPGALHNLVILDIRNCQGLKKMPRACSED